MAKLLQVIWDDSATYREWYDINELKAMIKEWQTVKSIGYLICSNDDRILLAGSIDGKGDKYSNIIVIARLAIIETKEIKETST